MRASTYCLQIPVSMTRAGYWLYVWRVTIPNGNEVLYVGRTGDSRYATANPPIVRMGQHFDRNVARSLLKNLNEHLIKLARRSGLNPLDYTANPYTAMSIVAHGPLFPPPGGDDAYHEERKVIVGPLERALRDALECNGHVVVGQHDKSGNLCHSCWQDVRQAFDPYFGLTLEHPNNQCLDHPCFEHA